jgi:hypothetical protein
MPEWLIKTGGITQDREFLDLPLTYTLTRNHWLLSTW